MGAAPFGRGQTGIRVNVMNDKIFLTLKDTETTDVYGLEEAFHIGYDDAEMLLYYLSLDGILVPTDKEGVLGVCHKALQSKDRIPYEECVALGMLLRDMNPYLYVEVVENEGITAKDGMEESLLSKMEALMLIRKENGAYHSCLPMGCARLISDVATHYTDLVYRYCLVEPMLYGMLQAGALSQDILKNPMILRSNRYLARVLLQAHEERGADLSPKFSFDPSDFEQELAGGFLASALCEFEATSAAEYSERILPYCRTLMDCAFLPKACKAAIRLATQRLSRMSDREIEYQKRLYRQLNVPASGVSRDMFDDALF